MDLNVEDTQSEAESQTEVRNTFTSGSELVMQINNSSQKKKRDNLGHLIKLLTD